MTPLRFLPPAEHVRLRDLRLAELQAYDAAHSQAPDDYSWTPEKQQIGRRYFPPGTMWLCPWYHDPKDPADIAKGERYLAEVKDWGPKGDQRPMLSKHFYTDWFRVRAPLCVVLPNYGEWMIDQRSSNGTGWKVTGWREGDVSQLVCSPSINYEKSATMPGYHGWLGMGGAPPGHLSNPI